MPSSSVKKHSTKSSSKKQKSVGRPKSTRRKSASKRSARKTFAPGCPKKTHKQKYVSSVKRYIRSSVASPVIQSEAFCTVKSMKRFNDHLKRMPLVSTSIKPDDDVRVSKMCVYDSIRLASESKPLYMKDIPL